MRMFYQGLLNILVGVIALLTAAIAAITFVDVTLRYLFRAPLPWSYDVSGVLLCALILLGLPLAVNGGRRMRPIGLGAITFARVVLLAALLVLLIIPAWQEITRDLRVGSLEIGVVAVPSVLISGSIFAGCLLALIVLACRIGISVGTRS